MGLGQLAAALMSAFHLCKDLDPLSSDQYPVPGCAGKSRAKNINNDCKKVSAFHLCKDPLPTAQCPPSAKMCGQEQGQKY